MNSVKGVNPDISPRIRNLRCSWRNSWVDRLQNHSSSYGSRRTGRNVKPDAVQNRIGQAVKPEIQKNTFTLLMIRQIYHFMVRLGEMSGLNQVGTGLPGNEEIILRSIFGRLAGSFPPLLQ